MRALLVAAALLVLGTLLHFGLALANPDSLWNIVHDNCVPAQSKGQNPGECRLVDLKARYAILKDMRGASHYLLLPTEQVPGIESPMILRADAPGYWEAAWRARQYVEESIGRPIPRQDLGLSINSARRRSQNQLHIHIDCVRREIRDALKSQEGQIAPAWPVAPTMLLGHPYFVRKIRAADLLGNDPFRLLAARLKDPSRDMAEHSLSVIGAEFADHTLGFYLLDSVYASNGAASDDVLDRSCRVLEAP